MKKMTFKLSVILISAVLLSSCMASHFGTPIVGNAACSSNNFKYVKFAQGQATAVYIFGFGGLARQSITADAKKDLLARNPLKDGQALANVTVDFKHSIYLGIYRELKATVTADIVEFNESK
jgi:hypothetical protein